MSRTTKNRVTLAEVAKLAGVSRSAVSRSFTVGASVAPSTLLRVREAATELGYRPNILARSLTTGLTGLVGLVANNFHNPVYLEWFDIFTRLLQARGLRTLLINLTDEVEPLRSLDLLMQYQVDAVVVATSTLPISFASAFAEAGLPVVHAFGRDNDGDFDVVGIDNREAGRIAARRLLACGYQSVGFLGGPESSTSTRDRLAGFMDVVEAHAGVQFQIGYSQTYSFEGGFEAMQVLMAGELAQGYFCGDDVVSIGAMSALRRGGIQVPEAVGIIGFNNVEMAAWDNIRLTTVAQPLAQIVEVTVDCLQAQLQSKEAYQPSAKLLPCQIIERDTLPKALS
ncbi:LacI family DNA-binding transcriptional regulator [Reinekea forsetii]|uniref:LacI family DNA-binding transcriptional regulator n=1 Tax=Reinekea forsetii TaxID=1336806 RepID=UPI0023556DDA|nr:LacI family DNA-binding transcriptional regulator [Reinekea forsetii]